MIWRILRIEMWNNNYIELTCKIKMMRNFFLIGLYFFFNLVHGQSLIWQNDFSTPSDWININNISGTPAHTGGNWLVTSNLFAIPIVELSPAGFSSASNGYAIINSQIPGASATQNSMFVTSANINLSSHQYVAVNFQQSHRRYAESTYFVYSIDGGANWNEIEVNVGMIANSNTANPSTIQIDLSSFIGNQTNVKIGFKYIGQYDWFWAIDDVKLIVPPLNNLTLNSVYTGSIGASGIKMTYYKTPISQISPIEISGVVTNNGFNPQNNVVFSTNVQGTTYSSSSSFSSLLPNQTDTFSVNLNFTPPSIIGNYTLNSSVSGDIENDLNDNVLNGPTIEINENVFARDIGITTNGLNLAFPCEFGNLFDIFNQTSVKGIQFFVHPLTISGTQVYAKLYSLNNQTGNLTLIESSLPFSISNSNLGQMLYIPLNSAVSLNSNQSYLAVVGSPSNNLVVGSSGIPPSNTSFYKNLSSGNWFSITNTPMVRMILCDPPSSSQIYSIQNNNICYPSNFNLFVEVFGGCEPYSVIITDGTSQYTQTGISPLNFNITPNNTCNFSIVSVTDVNGSNCSINNGSVNVIVTHPNDSIYTLSPINFCTGQSTTLMAQNQSGNTYQWYKNNNPIPGANTFFYTTGINPAGNYYLTSSIGNCSLNSNSLSVTTFTNTYQIYDTICGGPYSWNGVSYNSTGNYTQTFQAQNGCDSVVTLHLTVYPNNFNPTFSSSQQLFTSPPFAVQFSNITTNPSNFNFTWYWGDGTSTTSNNATVFHEYLTNGLYTVTLEATSIQTGCFDETTLTDYIYTTGGVSCTHSATINQTGPISACSGQGVVLSCNSSPTYSYQWRRNGVYISGNNNDSLLVTQPGAYSVIISDNGCPVSSSQVTVNFSTIAIPVISSNGSIQPCVGGSVTLSATSGYTSYLWSNGATTQSTAITSSGIYTVQVTNSSGCLITSNPFVVNASILPTQNICVVGVDSLTNNIRVVWEKPITTAIDSFYVYRESSVSNVFAQVGARPYDSLSVWIDPIANPAVQAYRYKITALDTCGSETPLSNFHKTIHLTINQGVGNSWNLIWSNYEGISFGSCNIYRGTSPSNLSLLTTIQSNLNSYTDLSAPVGNVYYQIEIVNPNNCNPTKSMNYSSSKSNIVTTNSSSIDELNESNILVYPNPANDLLTIESGSLLNSKFRIIDAVGRTVHQGLLSSNKNTLDISAFSKGTYTLIIENQRKPVRFIKQ